MRLSFTDVAAFLDWQGRGAPIFKPMRTARRPVHLKCCHLTILLPRKLPDPLFFAPFADEDAAVLFGDYVAIEALEDYFAGVFGVYYAVVAFVEADVAYNAVVVGVFSQFVVQRGPVAQVVPAEVGGVG